MKRQLLAGVAALLLGSAAQASEFFTSENELRANVNVAQVIDFNDLAEGTSFYPSPLAYRGLTMSVSQPGLMNPPGEYQGNKVVSASSDLAVYAVDGTNFAGIDLTPGATLTLSFLASQSAFGVTFAGIANDARMETINLIGINGAVLDSFIFANRSSTEANPNALAFFGARSAQPISGLTITYTPLRTSTSPVNDYFGLDNILFSTSMINAVPEPMTWAMMLGGFVMVGGAMRSSRRNAKVRYATA